MVAQVRSWWRAHPKMAIALVVAVAASLVLGVWLNVASGATANLSPDAIFTDQANWVQSAGTKVTAIAASGDGTYIYNATRNSVVEIIYSVEDPGAGWVINSVTMYVTARDLGTRGLTLNATIGGTALDTYTPTLTGTFATYNKVLATPAGGWDTTNLSALRVGVRPATAANITTQLQVDAVWFVVDYTAPSALSVAPGANRLISQVIRTNNDVIAVDQIALSSSGGASTVSQIVVRGISADNLLQTDVTQIRLFEDANNNGIYEVGTDSTQIGGDGTFSGNGSGSTVTFGGLTYAIPDATTRNILVVYTIGASAVDNHYVGSSIQTGDITTTGATVNFTSSPITSAVSGSGQTVRIDGSAPLANTTDPSSDTTLTGSSKTIAGTASDSVSGVASVELTIQRSDGQYWNGSVWAAGSTWLAATGTTSWTYVWSLDANQNGEYSYSVTARATDNVGKTGTDATPSTNVRVDNKAPTITSASAYSATQVDVNFSEPLLASSVQFGDFSIAGLTVSAATQIDADTWRLTTSAQTPGNAYTVSSAAGSFTDLVSNPNTATNAGFTGFVPTPTLTVTQGTDTGANARPATKVYLAGGQTRVAEEYVLTAANGNVTVSSLNVRGLDTVAALNADVTNVSLYRDDGDSVWDAGDTQLDTGKTFGGAAGDGSVFVTFSPAGGIIIAPATPEKLWVVYTVSNAAASDDHIVGTRIQTGDINAGGVPVTVVGSPINSTNSGQTLHIDSVAPSVSVSAPVSSASVGSSNLASATIQGTATDSVSGIAGASSIQVQIRRNSDNYYWSGASFQVGEAWVNVGSYVGGNWTYSWTFNPASQNGSPSYDIVARATDGVGLVGFSPAVTGVTVDNTGPSISSASAIIDATTVDVVFDQALAAGSISAGDFTILGLTVNNAVLQADNVTVRLTTTAQTPGLGYTVQVAAGNITDTRTPGNTNPNTSANFTGYGSPPTGGNLTVTQGSDVGRPTAKYFVTRNTVGVVDELVMSAAGGNVTVSQFVVRGLDTVGTLTTDVTLVRLYEEEGDGQFTGSETLVGSASFSGAASGSTATIGPLAYNIADATTKKLWIVYTIGGSAVDGHIVGSRVNGGDIIAASGSVNGFADIVSANSGQTMHVDALAPTANVTDPANNAVLTGSSKTIAITASDGSGSGLSDVSLSIRRSDGRYWDTDHWSVVEAWNPASLVSGSSWTYDWVLDAGQNRAYSYTITARAIDLLSQVGTDASPVTGVRVDNLGPGVITVIAVDAIHVDVTFNEALDPATVVATDFSIAGLNISAVNMLAGNTGVRLTVDAQTPSQSYTLVAAADAVADPYGHGNIAANVGFMGYDAGSGDTEPPSVPTNVVVTSGTVSPTIATVGWDASSDNVMVTGYRVWRSTTATGTPVLLGSTAGLSYADTTGVPGQTYYYRVSAYDSSGNESAKSDPASGPVSATWTMAPHATYGVGTRMCQLCHAPHVAATEKSLLRDAGAVPGELGVCYSCHDGQGASTNIATGPSNSFVLASGHVVEQVGETGDLTDACSGCHAPHVDYTSNQMLPRSTVNGVAVTGADNSWCLACHNDTNDWYGVGYPSLVTPTRDATGYPTYGTFPGRTVYESASANAHGAIEASVTAGREVGDCLYCHDSHRAPNGYDGLLETFRPTTAATLVDDQDNGTYAESCFDCHGGESGIWFAAPGPTGATDIQQFVTAGTTRSGHRIKTAGGNLPVGAPLPCYNCHNPHGSVRGNKQLLSDTLGQSLETSTGPGGAHLTREFCFTCHTSSDGQIWDSASAAYVAVGAQEVEGLERDGGDGSVLKIPSVSGHDSGDAQSCYQCHGSSYAPGGNNVHNPSGGVSAGGEDCYACHSTYQNYMEDGDGSKVGANRADAYHHVMGGFMNGGATYYDGDYAPGVGAYPAYTPIGTPAMYCVTCHVDHDKFNSNQAANLRSDSLVSAVPTNTDFHPTLGNSGVCTSCHGGPMDKDTTNQKDDGTTTTQMIDPGKFNVSAHQYEVRSSYGDSTQFRANCSKCHTDEQARDYQTSSATFGTHWSAERRLVSAFGVSTTDPLQEQHCYGCHSLQNAYVGAKTVAGKDYYGSAGANMDALSEKVYEIYENAAGSQHPVVATAGGSVECENCHNAHNVTKTSRVSDPDNTLNLAPYATAAEEAAYCIKCHDGSAPVATNTGVTYVPYTVTLNNTADNKATNAARGHWSAAGSIGAGEIVPCKSCHDNHGSSAPKLLGEYDVAAGTNKIGSTTITDNDNVVCSACHSSASTSFPAGETQREVSTGYLMDGTWPGTTIYNVAYVPATSTGNGHTSVAAVWPGKSYAGGDCKNCHDVHGTANAYDELRTEDAAGTPGVYGFDATDFSMCFNCHDGAPAGTDIKALFPPSAGGTNAGPRAGHRVVTSVSGANLAQGQAMPCYDCHNPHGSASAHQLQVRDIGDAPGEINVSTADGVRKFCFACHTAANTVEGWSGSAWVAAGVTTVEGFRRDSSDGSVMKLPAVAGHNKADTQSCYQCHGNDAMFNVHNPTGGESAGAQDCFSCHPYQSMQSNTSYHHYMTSDSAASYPMIADPTALTTTDARRTCLTCHVDHDYFVPALNTDAAHTAGRAQNFRSSVAVAPSMSNGATYVDYDYSDLDTGDGGVCTSCHKVRMLKNTTGRKSSTDRFNSTVPVSKDVFDTSAHNYFATAPDYTTQSKAANFTSDSSGFKVNCGKCHNDTMAKQFQAGPYTFGMHDSSIVAVLTNNGQAEVASEPQEQMCYLCHSRSSDTKPNNPNGGLGYVGDYPDMYGGAMMAGAMNSDSLNIKSMFTTATIVSSHPVAGDGTTTSRVECENCHNPHKTEADVGFSGPSGVVQDPDNTLVGSISEATSVYVVGPSTDAEFKTNRVFCMKCHDGTPPAKVNNGTAYVPYDVFIAPADAAKANKSAYLGRSHANAVAADTSVGAVTIQQACASCHDRHGSKYPALLGTTLDPVSAPTIAGAPITGNNNTVCDACHTNATTNYPAPTRETNGYPRLGTWPGSSVWGTAYTPATHTGSPHTTANGGGNSSLPSYSAGDCKVCHDVHGTANAYDETRLTFTPADFTLCFDCHDTDGPAARNIKTYYPGAIGGSGGGSGHEIQTPTGTLPAGSVLPCYNCHNPHGTSASSYSLLVISETAAGVPLVLGDAVNEVKMSPTDIGTAVNVRNFCFGCHTTGDTTKGWNGTALAVVTAGAKVEGIDRTIYDSVNKRGLKLPDRGGHREGDTTQSCYQCHGNDYSTLSSNNVHNPSGGVSNGGQDCYTCHTVYQSYMEDDAGTKTGANNGTVYHHVVGGTVGATYYEGDKAFAAGAYPTTTSEVFCLSCHVDHNLFNAPGHQQAQNLRPDLSASPPSGASTDWNDATNTGVCSACHATSLTKSGAAEKKSDGRTATPVIANAAYDTSAHKYATTSTYTDASTFSANCSKCHNDENSPSYKDFQTSTNRFGTHWSANQHILSALGGANVDQLQETHCYRCHSRTTDGLVGTKKTVEGRDWYNAVNMNVVAGTDYVYQQFQLASKHPVVADSGDSVECESCHNPHVVTTGTTKVTDPMNSYTAFTYGGASADTNQVTFCLRCHGNNGTGTPANLPARTINGTTYVPYSVTMAGGSTVTAPNNKYTNAARGHWSQTGAIGAGEEVSCAECHDNHGSTAPALLGLYDSASGTNKIGAVIVTGNNNTVCSGCHTGATGTSYTRLPSSGYPNIGTWPGMATYDGTNGIHKGVAVIWPDTPTLTGGLCINCHDTHGTAYAYDELLGQFNPSSAGDDRYALCFNCHDYTGVGTGPSTRNIKQYYPAADGGTGTSPQAGHQIKTAGGTLLVGQGLPCYNCHNPHGSAKADGLLVETMIAGTKYLMGDTATEIDMSTPAGVRRFCFLCHTTATGRGTNSAGTGYANISATDLVEGISRNPAVDNNALELSAIVAHTEADTQSCYQCHGNDYSTAAANNVHNPGPGGSTGGTDCYSAGCHGAYQQYMEDGIGAKTGASRATVHHHVLGSATNDGDKAFAAGSYPISTTDVYCVSCHVDHVFTSGSSLRSALIASPVGRDQDFIPGGAPSYGICLGCHTSTLTKQAPGTDQAAGGSASTPAIAGATYDASKHDYEVTLPGSTFKGNCTKCHNDYSPTDQLVLHYSSEERLIKALGALPPSGSSTEENHCYTCHSGAGTADGYGVAIGMTAASKAIQTEFARTTKHPVADSAAAGRHKSDEARTAGWNPAATRHVECEDCHNVHAAQAGVTPWPSNTAERGATMPGVAGSTTGVWGVNFNVGTVTAAGWTGYGTFGNPTALTSANYSVVNSATYQWQICLKCHSTFAWTTTAPTVSLNLAGQTGGRQTDIGNDFNRANYSVHPVLAEGKNQPTTNLNVNWTSTTYAGQRNINATGLGTYGLTNTFTDGWRTTSRTVCTDCHRSSDWTAPSGPHGSDNKWLLSGVDLNIKVTIRNGTVTTPNSDAVTGGYAANFCVNCHRKDVYGSGKSVGGTQDSIYGVLSRFNHDALNASCGNAAAGTGPLRAQLQWSGCVHCHGGRKSDASFNNPANTVVQSGAIHGVTMNEMAGNAGADPMGYRFMNGASWAGHTLADASGTSPTCYTLGTADNYSTCTAHTGGRSSNGTILYSWPRPTN